MAYRQFTASGFLLRWIVALVLVFLTFNPLGYSFFHWVTAPEGGQIPFKALAGVVLLILYIIYFRATWRSIGPVGLTLAVLFFGALIWAFVDLGFLNLQQPEVSAYVLLVIIATVMAIGLSWSHIRRRVSGQADIDDVDE